jgi:hypothetical protein
MIPKETQRTEVATVKSSKSAKDGFFAKFRDAFHQEKSRLETGKDVGKNRRGHNVTTLPK